MAETDQIAAPPPEDSAPNQVMDEETRLRPEFVDKVLDAVDAGDDETARRLVEPLHPADVADLIDKGVLRTTLDQTFGTINAANLKRAHALLESGKSRGKIVLEGW